MKPHVAVFSRTDPVTKLELWLCFKRKAVGFAEVQVDIAHSVIGLNAPRYMEKQGYLIKDKRKDGDFYVITQLGEEWLTRGILAYAKNHPSEATDIRFLPLKVPRVRRVRSG